MKKFAVALIASLAFVQGAHAITSLLGESLHEYTTLLGAIDTTFAGTIPENSIIIDIKRKTKKSNFSHPLDVHYHIRVDDKSDNNGTSKNYDALLHITPNPVIGPPIVEVVSITPRGQNDSNVSET